MATVINFRDFGGERTTSGGTVVTDRLYRSGHLAELDAAGLDRLLAHDFAAVIDLRYVDEREKERSPWPETALDRVVSHDGAATQDAPHIAIFASAMAGEARIDDAYAAFYGTLPFDALYRPLFAEAVRRIARTDGRVLIHCTAGKDRTGTLVALLLHLLGLPREAIVADYMRSLNAPGFDRLREDVRRRAFAKPDGPPLDDEQIEALIGVKPAYVEAVFEAVERRCGSVEAYFAEGGVTGEHIETLRRTLTLR